jgi:1A family penicillin-binding protein
MSDSPKRRKPLVADKRYPGGGARKTSTPPRKPRKPARRKAQPKRGLLSRLVRWILRLVWKITSRVALVACLILAAFVGYDYIQLPPLEKLLDGRARGSVTLLDRNGAVYAWRGDQFGGVVTADSVSPHVKHAFIATEDKRFYRHPGIDPIGVASAIRINLSEGRGPLSGHGGSTITQQTAKLLCLGVEYDPSEWKNEAAYVNECRRGSIRRKAEEAIYALAMELKYSKDDILSIYLNRAYLGAGAYGVEAAAQRYFSKPANALSPQEAAMLAGLLTAPSTLAPTNNLKRSQDRAATVLRLMREQNYLTAAQEAQAQASPATLSEAAEARRGGYFADWIMSDGPEFFTRNTTEDVIIRTTLDARIQAAVEAGMQQVFDEKVSEGSGAQAAVVVMSADGAVRGMVGGRDVTVSGAFNRATQARRQTGSAFKPFVYAAALDLGYSPYDTIVDEPFCMNIPGSGKWCPENYDRKYRGQVTLAQALENSLNVPAVKVANSVGLDLVRRVATEFGIESDLAAGPALALGASEASLLEMTGAFAGILNGGSAVTPFGLEELKMAGEDAPLMTAQGGIRERVIQEDAARQLVWMMHQVVESGTGTRAKFGGWEIAGKTGTTQAARDAWFIAFTADYVTGVWMGYDDNTPLTGTTGGGLPADIWREVMRRVHEGDSPRPLPLAREIGPGDVVDGGVPRYDGSSTGTRGSGNALEDMVNSVLRDIFGGSSGSSGSSGTRPTAPSPSGGDR